MSAQEEALGFLVAERLEEPKPPVGLFTLPGGVYLDGTVHKDVVLNEISGYEEDLLGNSKIAPEKKLEQLIKQVIASIGPITDKKVIHDAVPTMLTGDRAFLIIALRRLSLGDTYDFIVECPKCKAKDLQHVDLGTLEVKAAEGDRVQNVTTPSGKKVVWHFMTGFDETRNNSLQNREQDLLSIGLAARIDAINGQPANMAMIKSLSSRDREFLRAQFEACEPGIDMQIDLQCTKCQHEYSQDMDIDIGFFFPSQVQKLWKKIS